MPEYEMKTTFMQDFAIAECFGESAVRDTYNRAKEDWKDNTVYLTELVMVLNWRLWGHYQNGNRKMAELYNELWENADLFAQEHLKGEDLDYFYRTTD